MLSHVFSLPRAANWFLHSGIQEQSGGVARYYDAASRQYRAVSTEITGYAASTFAYLYRVTGEEIYLARAIHTARFLAAHAWDGQLQSFPFEHPSPSDHREHLTYFFDTGIIIRGLLAVWRLTQEDRLLHVATAAARHMAFDFHSGNDYHPILALPGKMPLSRDLRWSRSSDCYQLKAAVAWWEIAEITGDEELRGKYDALLRTALSQHEDFLPGTEDEFRVMDRLHAYLYFLEGLLVGSAYRQECESAYRFGLAAVEKYLGGIAPSFLRADVCAQLLRARLNGCLARFGGVDEAAAAREADLVASFQMNNADGRIDGGVAFGRREGETVPHINPWATGFAIQALQMWEQFRAGKLEAQPQLLI